MKIVIIFCAFPSFQLKLILWCGSKDVLNTASESAPFSNNSTNADHNTDMFETVRVIVKYECKENMSIFGFVGNFLAKITNLYELDVSFIGAEKFRLPNGNITFTEIRKFNASHNYLDQVSKDILLHLPNLYSVDLSFNQIRKIDKDDFNGHDELSEIIMNSNHIKNIDISAFSKLKSFGLSLDLSNNEINTENLSGRFKDNKQMIELNLMGNPLKSFSFQLEYFTDFGVITHLPTEIESVDISCNNKRKACHSSNVLINSEDLKNFRIFNASRNDKYHVLDFHQWFKGLNTKMEILDLSWANMRSWDLYNLNELVQLRHLNLSHSNIGTIRANAFENQLHLLSLDLSFNYLTRVDFNISPTLLSLNLDGNQLITIDLNVTMELRSFNSLAIKLKLNQFDCIYSEKFPNPLNSKELHLVNDLIAEGSKVKGFYCTPRAESTLLKPSGGEVQDLKSTSTHQNGESGKKGSTSYVTFEILAFVVTLVICFVLFIVVLYYRSKNFMRVEQIEMPQTSNRPK